MTRIGAMAMLIAGLGLAVDGAASSRSGLVYASGEIRMGSTARLSQAHDPCEQDPDLLFRFTETASPGELRLVAGGSEQGQVHIDLVIDLACRPGSATFEYAHHTDGGWSDANAQISPRSPLVTIALQAGATASVTVDYQLLDARIRRAQATLQGDRITFVAGDTFGQTGERRDLASILFLGDVLDEGAVDLAGNRRQRDAGRALNEACRQAEPGTQFAEACGQIRDHAVTTERQLQAADAFDAHALAATSQAAAEGGRIQADNVRGRLAQIRAGGPRASVSGLSFSFNGQRFDAGWLPQSLSLDDEGERGRRLLGDRWGVFVNGNVSLGSRSERDKEVGFDFNSWGLTGGVDYRFDRGAVAGLALGYGRHDADIDNDGGSLDGDVYSIQLFGSLDLATHLYADLTAGYSRTDFDQQRVVDLSGIGSLAREVARGATRSEQYSASLALNYRWQLNNGITLTPYGQYYLADVSIDGFSEQGSVFAFRYPDQSYTSRLWSAGLRGSRAITRERFVMMPFVDLAWQYQGGIDSYRVQPTLSGADLFGPEVEISDPDRHFGRLDAGLSWVFPTGNQMFFSYSAVLFERDTTQHTFTLGGRWEF